MNVTKIVVFCLLWSNLVKVKFKCMQDKKPTFVLKKLQFYFRLLEDIHYILLERKARLSGQRKTSGYCQLS